METLCFKKVTRDVESTEFDCGIASINEEINNSYYPSLIREASAFSISRGDKIVGYCAVLFKEIELDDFPEKVSEYETEWKEFKIAVVHIKYIAVRKEYQGKGVGTAILRTIIAKVRKLAETWPIRVITMDARNELVNWYLKENFAKMLVNPTQQEGVSTAMYIECNPFTEELEEYISSNTY